MLILWTQQKIGKDEININNDHKIGTYNFVWLDNFSFKFDQNCKKLSKTFLGAHDNESVV